MTTELGGEIQTTTEVETISLSPPTSAGTRNPSAVIAGLIVAVSLCLLLAVAIVIIVLCQVKRRHETDGVKISSNGEESSAKVYAFGKF